ncbi:hypothetical protein ACFTZI_08325 [Streptomyces decoyicus]|uniref:hypothetical protein n=1 Tax=Streptomyces decoyicus TaxID=249567 RepID=UPI003631475C
MTDIDAVVARLRQLPDVSGGLVELEPGIDDARMDSWPVPVPAEIRVLFRSIGGIRITVRRSVVNGHTSAEHVDFTEAFNNGEYLGHDVSWYLEHAGGRGSHWFVYLDHGDGHFYVDVDRETGAWGPVFQFWDATDTRRLALSLPDWLQRLGDCVHQAVAEAGTADTNAFGTAFTDRWCEPTGDAVPVAPIRATDARSSDDPVLRDAAAGLPDDALLADLRPVAGVAEVLFDLPVSCRYARRDGGAVLTAVQWDGE